MKKDPFPNPFKFGEIVKQDTFCPRPDLSKRLNGIIRAGNNAVVLGERRTGKTSLMLEAAGRVRGTKVIYVHLWSISSIEDLVNRILQGLTTMKAEKDSFLEKAVRSLGSLRPVIDIDPHTGSPSLTVGQSGSALLPSSLHGIFDFIAELGEQQKIVVILDEFQDVRRIKDSDAILGEIRGRIQLQAGIPYLFAGSIRHEMETIFRDPSSPFFKSFRTIEVGPIDRATFQTYLAERFEMGDRNVLDNTWPQIFDLTLENPSDVQQLCSAIWERSASGDTIEADCLPEVLRYIFSSERKGYEYLVRPLTNQQLNCLKTLARIGGGRPQSKEFLRESGIAVPSSVKRALTRLMDLEIIYGPELNYKFFDPFFRQWLNRGFMP